MEQASPQKRSLARLVTALFNRCPRWTASLHETLPEIQVVVRSPSGAAYAFGLQTEGSVDKVAVQALLEALAPGQRGVLVSSTGEYTREAAELARAHKIMTWSLSQLDYLTMAAELEMSAPLAYVGLEVEAPRFTPEVKRLSTITGVFHV